AEMLGYSQEELLGEHWSCISSSDQLIRIEEENRERRQLRTTTYEATLLTKDGENIPVIVSGTPLLTSNGHFRGTLAVFTDISELKRVEDALRMSELKYRELVEELHEGVLVEYDDLISLVNPQLTDLLGYTEEELIGQYWTIIVAPEHLEKVKEENQERLQGASSNYEINLLTKDGSRIPVIVSGTPLLDDNNDFRGTLAVFTDIRDRKQMENELEESLSLLSATLESTADGILVVNSEGTIISFNQRFADMWRIPSSILESRENEKALSHVLDQLREPERFLAKVEELYNNPKAESYDVLEFKDKRVFERYSKPQMIGSESVGRVWSFRDVTEQIQAEEARRESELKYRELVEELHEGVLVESNGRITFVNPQVTELLGYTEEELVGQHWRIIVAPDSFSTVNTENRKRLQGHSTTYEINLQTKNGQSVPVIVSGSPLFSPSGVFRGTLAIFTDISQLKMAEQALRESESRYRDILEKMSDGYYETDLRGNFTFFNEAICTLLGYLPNELLGMNYREIVDEETAKATFQAFNALFRTRKPAHPFVGTIARKDGTERFAETAPSLIFDSNSEEPIGFRGVLRDTTERKQTEEQLKRQKEELSDFAHAMSHDLRNYFLAIDGYAHILINESNDATYAQKIRQLSQNADHLMHRSVMLADAGMAIEKTAEVDLNQVVRETAEITIPSHIVFLCEVLPKVHGDHEKLSQVFQNLFENAVVHANPTAIEIIQHQTDNTIDLLISNDGKPISLENRSRIFQRGFTTKENGGGLGLRIIKKLIEAHNWQIQIESSVNTTFRISIPKNQTILQIS
ncbi:MAG: PAS domain S-box protein, partial [Candidatus Hodarchaeales archaeon]